MEQTSDNINISRIKMEQVDMPIFIRLGERLKTYQDQPKQAVGSISNVTIKNVKAVTRDTAHSRVVPPSGIFITGTPNHKIESVRLQNIQIVLPGGGTDSLRNVTVSEQIDRYPEFSFFGPLPAYGLTGRHIERLSIRECYLYIDRG